MTSTAAPAVQWTTHAVERLWSRSGRRDYRLAPEDVEAAVAARLGVGRIAGEYRTCRVGRLTYVACWQGDRWVLITVHKGGHRRGQRAV